MKKIKQYYTLLRKSIIIKIIKRKVNFSDVSLISMNCIGGVLYHDIESKFLSPTVNLFFTAPDFIKFVNNIDYYLSLTPMVHTSEDYPIGVLDDIMIHFMHYNSCEDALSKWEQRKKRINKDRLFVIMVEQNGFTNKEFEQFLNIKYPKLLFTRSTEYECADSLYFPRFRKKNQLPDIIPGRKMYYKFRLIKAINNAYGKN